MQRLIAYRTRQRLAHLARGLRYAFGRSTTDDALTMICELERVAGYYALETISEEDVATDVLEEYEDTPALREVCANAALRVAHKWNSTGDVNSAARDWALDLVREWAAEHGLSGLPTDEEIAA